MRVYYSPVHAMHNPGFEIFDGGERMPSFETPERAERILAALRGAAWAAIAEPGEVSQETIAAVHDAGYLHFLETAYADWLATPPDGPKQGLLPATFPPAGWRRQPSSVLGRAGYYMMDLSAPVAAGTYRAAIWAAACAANAARTVVESRESSFALCRPPGHHAGKANCGGYCYINNAAVAAQWISARGKVAVLDVDYHAGNGTQDIFYERDDVLTVSIHGDPAEEYPYFCGYADETGRAAGEGFHRNFPLPAGTGDTAYLEVLDQALALIGEFKPAFLVVSIGTDIYEGDPLGTFKVTRAGIGRIGRQIARAGIPTALIMEGGYDNDALGANVLAMLEPFAG
jgi:acetoin utilization deacetylase AcuC-like enzyme